MEKVNIELTTEDYKNIHLLMHSLIELTNNLHQNEQIPIGYRNLFNELKGGIETVKVAIEVKD